MKRLWIALALLVAVILLCVSTEVYQHRRIEDMMALLDRLEQAFHNGDQQAVGRLAEDLVQQYDSASRVFMCFTAHADVAESQETVALLGALAQKNGTEELAMEIARLREQLTYLRNVDDPLLWNIL